VLVAEEVVEELLTVAVELEDVEMIVGLIEIEAEELIDEELVVTDTIVGLIETETLVDELVETILVVLLDVLLVVATKDEELVDTTLELLVDGTKELLLLLDIGLQSPVGGVQFGSVRHPNSSPSPIRIVYTPV
jgi:hypothetical protein